MIALEHQVHRHRLRVDRRIVFSFRKTVQALIFRIPVARSKEARATRDRERSDDLLILLIDPADAIERRHFIFVHAFHHGELRGLLFGNNDCRRVCRNEHASTADHCNDRADLHGSQREFLMVLLMQVPRSNCHGHERAHDEHRADHMRVARKR